MKGYRNRPEATAAALKGGWLHTGDLGYADSDGFYFIVDRTRTWWSAAVTTSTRARSRKCCTPTPAFAKRPVIGKPDERLGEEVVAVVVLDAEASLGEQEVIAYCRERLAAYQYPREVRFRGELPKGPTGKILKTELREP